MPPVLPPAVPPVVPPVVNPLVDPPVVPPVIMPPVPAIPVIRQSLGAKTGVNLLSDLEKWGYPDGQKVTQASLTINDLSIKELRDLCTKLPPKIRAELQITLPPEEGPKR